MSLEILFDVVFNGVTWEGYDYSTKLQHTYKTFFNGSKEDLKPYLRTLKKRETDEEIESRLNASNFLNKALYNSLKKNLNSLSFKDYKVTQLEENDLVNENLRLFFDDRPIDEYIFKVLLDDTLLDPNGLVYLQKEDKVSPTFINSENILWKEKKKGAFQFVVIKKDDGYIAFLDGKIFNFTELEQGSCKKIESVEDLEEGNIEFRGKKYNLEVTKGYDFAPFVSVGFIYSIEDKSVYLSYFDSAVSYFKKLTSLVSEHDITELKQAFPKIFAYEQKCSGEGHGKPCDNGFCHTTNETCNRCGGTGVILSKSGQDIVTIPIPDNRGIEEFVDLSKLYYEHQAPISTLEYQKNGIREVLEDAKASIYGKDDIENVNKTATSRLIEVEKSNQALYPFANNIKRIYEVIAKQSSLLLGQPNNDFEFTFPQKLIELNESELIELIKEAKDNSLPQSIIQEYENRLAKTVFKNNKYKAKIHDIVIKLKPFNDSPKAEILALKDTGLVNEDDVILNLNFDRFLKEVERGYLESQSSIIDASIKEVETKILERLKEFKKTIKPQEPNLEI